MVVANTWSQVSASTGGVVGVLHELLYLVHCRLLAEHDIHQQLPRHTGIL